MDSLCQTVWVISSFLLYLFDQGTDALTALLFFLDGHYLEGVLTALLIFTPGLAACMLELRDMWRGKGNILKAIVYLVMCPLWALLTHLYSVFNKQWQSKALMLKTMEGFLCAAPQLVLQLSFWMRGTLTTPMEMILADQFNVTKQWGDTVNMTIFGRDFDSNERYWFGIAQFLSILISFISVFSSVIYFNRLEANSVRSVGKLCLGIPFFLLTIVYRSVGLALLLCFLRWWSSIIIFLLFFTTVLTALCIGDRFGRSCLYGIWSLLVPVGYSRDPVSPLGYYSIQSLDILEIEELSQPQVVQDGQRSTYFLTSHMLSSLLILFPSLAILTVLVHRAQVISSLTISTTSIFPTYYISMLFLPTLGLCLAVSLLLVRPFLSADCTKGEAKKGNILV